MDVILSEKRPVIGLLSQLGLCGRCILRLCSVSDESLMLVSNQIIESQLSMQPQTVICPVCCGILQYFEVGYPGQPNTLGPLILNELHSEGYESDDFGLTLTLPALLSIRAALVDAALTQGVGHAGVGQIGLKEAIKIVASEWITKNTGMRASHQQSAFHVNLTLRLTHTEISYAALSVLAATVQQHSCCGGIGGIGGSNETKIGTGRFINAAFPMSEEKAKRQRLNSDDPISAGSVVAVTKALETIQQHQLQHHFDSLLLLRSDFGLFPMTPVAFHLLPNTSSILTSAAVSSDKESSQSVDVAHVHTVSVTDSVDALHLIPTFVVNLSRDAILLGGLYQKWDRELSQTPFLINGVQLACVVDSVHQLIARPLERIFGADCMFCLPSKFHSSGREDLDVRMLGEIHDTITGVSPIAFLPQHASATHCNSISIAATQHALTAESYSDNWDGRGRQFVLELSNARRHPSSQSVQRWIDAAISRTRICGDGDTKLDSGATCVTPLEQCELAVNNHPDSFLRIAIRHLKLEDKTCFEYLKFGETHKLKEYRCVVWSSCGITEAKLSNLVLRIQNLVIVQKTPLRVLHRRTALDRKRLLHSSRATLIPSFVKTHSAFQTGSHDKESHFFYLDLVTQAGTYIKEFVHGDRGRTRPSVADLLQCEQADILQLDVIQLLPPRVISSDLQRELQIDSDDDDE